MKKLIAGLAVVLGALSTPTSAEAHWLNYEPNHAHVCTSYTSLNVRSGPGTNYSTVGSVAKNSKVTIKGSYGSWEDHYDTWYRIYYGSGTGYVSSDYVCF